MIRRCGFVTVVGRPNVGKSTLINRLLGEKLSITSNKPQTTRHRILGIHHFDDAQIIYVDTPGIHEYHGRALNRLMNRTAINAVHGVDVVLAMVEATGWRSEDTHVLERIADSGVPVILGVNKVDRVKDKSELLPRLEDYWKRGSFVEMVPLSARRGTNLDRLQSLIVERLPEGEAVFPEGQRTDRSERFIVAELVREQLFERLAQEVPYQLSVEVERLERGEERLHVSAVIWVERKAQKGIVIGKEGRVLKAVGTQARAEISRWCGQHVTLELWVKVLDGWSDDAGALRRFGYGEV